MMEWNIPDLLDDLQDETVNLTPYAQLSAERIKELTMKKIHHKEKNKRRGTSFLWKMALVAAILATLAIPVMAATGFRLTDWLEGLNKSDLVQWQEHYESWEKTEGFWQIGMTSRDLTREGMTLSVREAQDSPVTGTLTIHGGYWLERWDGEKFVPMTAAAEPEKDADREIREDDCFELEIRWVDAYGALESGRYRLGKEFTYTYSDGKSCKLTEWAEFRIFNEDMTPYIRQCKNALEELLNRESYHVSFATYGYALSPENVTDLFSHEIWKSGADHLLIRSVENYAENLRGSWGEMLLNGEGYAIDSWISGDVMQGADKWEYDHLLSADLNQFDIWYFYMSFEESQVGEIWVEENTIGVLCAAYPEPNIVKYMEYLFHFDEAGTLVAAEKYYLSEPNCPQEEKWINCEMAVHVTPANEVRQVIDAQKVGIPAAFSWEEERAQYTPGMAGVKTSGFANTSPVAIETGYEAFLRAFGDYDVVAETHHTSAVSYDTETGMWKVEFWWANGDVYAIIYMDAQGITQLTVMKPYTE